MTRLFDTRVNKYSTCLSYALDRTGNTGAYKFVTEIPREKFIVYDPDILEIGDIVAWPNKVLQQLFDTSIVSIEGYPVTVANLEDTSFHLGVIERFIGLNDMIISDATRSMNSHYLTEIRLSLYNKFDNNRNNSKLPEYIIKL
jgi:hypothetical protein